MATVVRFVWEGDVASLPLDLQGLEYELVDNDEVLWLKLADGRALRFTLGGAAEFDLTTFDYLRGMPNPNIDYERMAANERAALQLDTPGEDSVVAHAQEIPEGSE